MNEPAPSGSGNTPAAISGPTQYSLIEVALQTIADLAPTLKEAELRVLLELARRQIAAGAAIAASSRELATYCKMGRSNVVLAIDTLTTRGLLTTRQGSATKPATYQVNAILTVRMGGPITGPPPPIGWSQNRTTVDLFQDQGGPITGPPPPESKALKRAAPPLDVFEGFPQELDRVLRSQIQDFDADLAAHFRRQLHYYMGKFGRDPVDGRRYLDTSRTAPHPDNEILARFLACGTGQQLADLMENLILDAKQEDSRLNPRGPGSDNGAGSLQPLSYAWFWRVAISRIHGIHWTISQQAQAKFRLYKKGQTTGKLPVNRPPPAEQTGLEFAEDLQQQIRAAAGGKKL